MEVGTDLESLRDGSNSLREGVERAVMDMPEPEPRRASSASSSVSVGGNEAPPVAREVSEVEPVTPGDVSRPQQSAEPEEPIPGFTVLPASSSASSRSAQSVRSSLPRGMSISSGTSRVASEGSSLRRQLVGSGMVDAAPSRELSKGSDKSASPDPVSIVNEKDDKEDGSGSSSPGAAASFQSTGNEEANPEVNAEPRLEEDNQAVELVSEHSAKPDTNPVPVDAPATPSQLSEGRDPAISSIPTNSEVSFAFAPEEPGAPSSGEGTPAGAAEAPLEAKDADTKTEDVARKPPDVPPMDDEDSSYSEPVIFTASPAAMPGSQRDPPQQLQEALVDRSQPVEEADAAAQTNEAHEATDHPRGVGNVTPDNDLVDVSKTTQLSTMFADESPEKQWAPSEGTDHHADLSDVVHSPFLEDEEDACVAEARHPTKEAAEDSQGPLGPANDVSRAANPADNMGAFSTEGPNERSDAFFSFDNGGESGYGDDGTTHGSLADPYLAFPWKDSGASAIIGGGKGTTTPPPGDLPRPRGPPTDPFTGIPSRVTAPRRNHRPFSPMEPSSSFLMTPISDDGLAPSEQSQPNDERSSALQAQPTDVAKVIHSFLSKQGGKHLAAVEDVEKKARKRVEEACMEKWWDIVVEEAAAFGALSTPTPPRRREPRPTEVYRTPPTLWTPRQKAAQARGWADQPDSEAEQPPATRASFSSYDFNMPRPWGLSPPHRSSILSDGNTNTNSNGGAGGGGDDSFDALRRESLGYSSSLRTQAASLAANVSALCADEMLYRSYIEDKEREAFYLLARLHQCVTDALQPTHIYLLERSSWRAIEAEAKRDERRMREYYSYAVVDDEIRLFRSAVRQRATLIEMEEKIRENVIPVDEAREREQIPHPPPPRACGTHSAGRTPGAAAWTRGFGFALERLVYAEKLEREELHVKEVRGRAGLYEAAASGYMPPSSQPATPRSSGVDNGDTDGVHDDGDDDALELKHEGPDALPEVEYYIDEDGNLRSVVRQSESPLRENSADLSNSRPRSGKRDSGPQFFEWNPTNNSTGGSHSHNHLRDETTHPRTADTSSSPSANARGAPVAIPETASADPDGECLSSRKDVWSDPLAGREDSQRRSPTVVVTPQEAEVSALLHALQQTPTAVERGNKDDGGDAAMGSPAEVVTPRRSSPGALVDGGGGATPTQRALARSGGRRSSPGTPTPNRHVIPCSLRPFPHKSYDSVIRDLRGGGSPSRTAGRVRPYDDSIVYRPSAAALRAQDEAQAAQSDDDPMDWSTEEVGQRSVLAGEDRMPSPCTPRDAPATRMERSPTRVPEPPRSPPNPRREVFPEYHHDGQAAHSPSSPPRPSPSRSPSPGGTHRRQRSGSFPRYLAPTAASLRQQHDSALMRVLLEEAAANRPGGTPTTTRCSSASRRQRWDQGSPAPLLISRLPPAREPGSWATAPQERNPYGPGYRLATTATATQRPTSAVRTHPNRAARGTNRPRADGYPPAHLDPEEEEALTEESADYCEAEMGYGPRGREANRRRLIPEQPAQRRPRARRGSDATRPPTQPTPACRAGPRPHRCRTSAPCARKRLRRSERGLHGRRAVSVAAPRCGTSCLPHPASLHVAAFLQ